LRGVACNCASLLDLIIINGTHAVIEAGELSVSQDAQYIRMMSFGGNCDYEGHYEACLGLHKLGECQLFFLIHQGTPIGFFGIEHAQEEFDDFVNVLFEFKFIYLKEAYRGIGASAQLTEKGFRFAVERMVRIREETEKLVQFSPRLEGISDEGRLVGKRLLTQLKAWSEENKDWIGWMSKSN